MSVVKGKRKESQFEVIKHFYRLSRQQIVNMNDFFTKLKEEEYNESKNK